MPNIPCPDFFKIKLLSELTNDRFHETAGTRQWPDDPRRTRIGHVGAQLGIREYWQYDPAGDYLDPRLQALQLIERNYWPLRSPGGSSLHSGVLGLDLRLEEGVLRFYDPHTGEKLRSHRRPSKPGWKRSRPGWKRSKPGWKPNECIAGNDSAPGCRGAARRTGCPGAGNDPQ